MLLRGTRKTLKLSPADTALAFMTLNVIQDQTISQTEQNCLQRRTTMRQGHTGGTESRRQRGTGEWDQTITRREKGGGKTREHGIEKQNLTRNTEFKIRTAKTTAQP